MCPANDTSPQLWNYVAFQLSARGLSSGDLSRATGINRSQLSTWRRGGKITIDSARTLARFFECPLLEVLVAAGLITADEAELRQAQPDLAAISNTALAAELHRRLTTATTSADRRPSHVG
ncbi:helix-turn-helix domain-containing protein [Saccharothrix variisporea]|uniref:Helix-turn-helix protein n=1 Tax=Saccharothrix variisporea TaxID=543527 RepID=A0A495X5R6_9PSEU|nr:helix-turn-helix transcriptional regulator [Saccharothrix variisporea]RKT69380.1 helix-turn-helix protein [Saccharothrix variisporea]